MALLTKSYHRPELPDLAVKIQEYSAKFEFQVSRAFFKASVYSMQYLFHARDYLLFIWDSNLTGHPVVSLDLNTGTPRGALLRVQRGSSGKEPNTVTSGLLRQLAVPRFWKPLTYSPCQGWFTTFFQCFSEFYFSRFFPWLCKFEFLQCMLYSVALRRFLLPWLYAN